MSNNIATWLNKGYAEKLVKSAESFWGDAKNWMIWAVNQKNEQECQEPILSLIAWERLTEQIKNEPKDLYRKRVQHAFINTVEAGEISSIKEIFSRLDIDVINVTERIDGRDWDIIAIDFSSATTSKYGDILPEVIQLYGRACRRYEFAVKSHVNVDFSIASLGVQWDASHTESELILNAESSITMDHIIACIGAEYTVHTAIYTATMDNVNE